MLGEAEMLRVIERVMLRVIERVIESVIARPSDPKLHVSSSLPCVCDLKP
jgi:hypothetical protein